MLPALRRGWYIPSTHWTLSAQTDSRGRETRPRIGPRDTRPSSSSSYVGDAAPHFNRVRWDPWPLDQRPLRFRQSWWTHYTTARWLRPSATRSQILLPLLLQKPSFTSTTINSNTNKNTATSYTTYINKKSHDDDVLITTTHSNKGTKDSYDVDTAHIITTAEHTKQFDSETNSEIGDNGGAEDVSEEFDSDGESNE